VILEDNLTTAQAKFALAAIVYLADNHYTCLLKHGAKWYEYDGLHNSGKVYSQPQHDEAPLYLNG
ncbi:hypothetical protein HDU76_011584, partial [Blyttiomyces sp. JEL0837]